MAISGGSSGAASRKARFIGDRPRGLDVAAEDQDAADRAVGDLRTSLRGRGRSRLVPTNPTISIWPIWRASIGVDLGLGRAAKGRATRGGNDQENAPAGHKQRQAKGGIRSYSMTE
jgi:hypothetical protein